jgi:hypothetical protein
MKQHIVLFGFWNNPAEHLGRSACFGWVAPKIQVWRREEPFTNLMMELSCEKFKLA